MDSITIWNVWEIIKSSQTKEEERVVSYTRSDEQSEKELSGNRPGRNKREEKGRGRESPRSDCSRLAFAQRNRATVGATPDSGESGAASGANARKGYYVAIICNNANIKGGRGFQLERSANPGTGRQLFPPFNSSFTRFIKDHHFLRSIRLPPDTRGLSAHHLTPTRGIAGR